MIPIVLKVYDGGRLKGSRAFRAERIRLGSASADLVLDSPSVAPNHAVIESGATGVVLRALGTAPLYLNGQPILAAPLRHGDLISIGDLRIMVELQKGAAAPQPQKTRPRLQLIHGEEVPPNDPARAHTPTLSVVREAIPEIAAHSDQGLHEEVPPPPTPVHIDDAPIQMPVQTQQESAAVAMPAETPAPALCSVLPPVSAAGGECAEAELFWGDTRVSVWQLLPGERLLAGSQPGCDAMLQGIDRAAVLRSDVNGWTVAAPRPLQLFLEEDGHVVGGPELLVRGRSQADAHGLVVPLPQRAVAVLTSGNLSLRIRRVRGVARVGGEQADWKGVLVASVAAILMMFGMKFWSSTVPPITSAGEAELIKPRPLIVRAAVPKPNNAPTEPHKQQNQARNDPGKAVARHMGLEGQAGSRTAPRRDARAERKMDDKALVAQTGLLKALGGGKGGLRGKENGEIGLGPEKPEVQGSIDPELIRKVVHDHRAQIRTCYETQLTSRPNLAGKLVSAWTIDQSGTVTEAHTQESTLHDHTVEGCVASKIKTWRFPIPKGGGEVFVTYPFIFTPGG